MVHYVPLVYEYFFIYEKGNVQGNGCGLGRAVWWVSRIPVQPVVGPDVYGWYVK